MRIVFDYGKNPHNFHKNNKEGSETIFGPKFALVKLRGIAPPTTAYRFIFYKPSGAWLYFDITFDRRNLK